MFMGINADEYAPCFRAEWDLYESEVVRATVTNNGYNYGGVMSQKCLC